MIQKPWLLFIASSKRCFGFIWALKGINSLTIINQTEHIKSCGTVKFFFVGDKHFLDLMIL